MYYVYKQVQTRVELLYDVLVYKYIVPVYIYLYRLDEQCARCTMYTPQATVDEQLSDLCVSSISIYR